MQKSLHKSYYSKSFNLLKYYGVWPIESDNNFVKNMFKAYQLGMFLFTTFLLICFFVDLHLHLGNLKKMSWNICVNALFFGSILKTLIIYPKSDVLNQLRAKLSKDEESRMLSSSGKESKASEVAQKHFSVMERIVNMCATSFIAVWLVSRFTIREENKRLLPVPIYIPFQVDLNDAFQYTLTFIVLAYLAVAGLIYIIQQEMAMFGVLFQVIREYNVLLEDIGKLDDVYRSECINNDLVDGVINPFLQKRKGEIWLRYISIRQRTLMGYVNTFEFCYNKSLLLQLSLSTVLGVTLGIQIILLKLDFASELIYQTGYTFIVLADVFLLCLLGNKIKSQNLDVGHALYSTTWYEMNRGIQNDVILIILMSQKIPRITTFKAANVDLEMFKLVIRSIYSCLTLFHQLASKGAV